MVFFSFSGSCSSANRNSLSIHLDHNMKLFKNGTWKHSKLSDKDYDTYHKKGTKAKYHENSEKKLLVDSYDNFVLMAEIN